MAEAPHPKKILLIDDDERAYRMLLRTVAGMSHGPWTLEWADTYEKGLKQLLGGGHAVCLLDHRLDQGAEGLQLLRKAQAAECATPVVMLTADLDPSLDEAALEAGAVDFLVKAEFTPRELGRCLRYACRLGEMLGRLRQEAVRDQLTGLANRRDFDRHLREEWQRSARYQRSFALVLLDIDLFKSVNDTHGHQVGDRVLRHVASLLAGQARTVDRVARHGGEEFALLMIESTRSDARDAVDRLRQLLEETPCIIPEKNLTIPVTISAGVAAMPEDAETVEQLIEAADSALYTAKRLGRNRVVTTKLRAMQAPWQALPAPVLES